MAGQLTPPSPRTLEASDKNTERLIDRLGYASDSESLVRALIGNALLVETSEAALNLVAHYPGAVIVSLEGTVVQPNGVISGGSGDEVAAAIVEQKREMRELAQQLKILDVEYSSAASAHQMLLQQITAAETALDAARRSAHQGELAHVAAQKDLARASAELAKTKIRGEALAKEEADLGQDLQEAIAFETSTRSRHDELAGKLEHFQFEVTRAETEAEARHERTAAQATLVTERKVRLAQVKEQLEATVSALERVTRSLTELNQRTVQLERLIVEAAASYGETAAYIMTHRQRRVVLLATARAHQAGLETAKAELEEVRGILGGQEFRLREVRGDLARVEGEERDHDMALQKRELEQEHLLEDTRRRFRGLELHTVVGDYHARPAPDEEHRRRIQELTQLIDRMGPVNLQATEEFDDAERRYLELSGQRDDIEKALTELERAIRHMNRETRKRFKETFDTVNELFKQAFARMFRGGKAELRLTDPEDLLATGVDIVAQPPGKKLGNIDLMSGGEKALTAVSLIFAIFQHKPSPFCVLDEVDAPLDEANVARYNEAIRSMTNRSQFILITHIRQTMQAVDVLYGVTMGDPGVSRIVSVKVNDAATQRSEAGSRRLTGGVRDANPSESEEAALSTGETPASEEAQIQVA